jgi:hypothetical protein
MRHPYPYGMIASQNLFVCLTQGRRCEGMDRKASRKRGREEAVDFPFEEAGSGVDGGVGEASRRPPGVFQLPWQKCRGGLGVPAECGAPGWELRDVFFSSLVDGGAAAIGVPGDRLVSPPPTRRALLDGVDAWLAAAADDDVDPAWRSALKGEPVTSLRPAPVGRTPRGVTFIQWAAPPRPPSGA